MQRGWEKGRLVEESVKVSKVVFKSPPGISFFEVSRSASMDKIKES